MSFTARSFDESAEPRLGDDSDVGNPPLRFPTEARRGEAPRATFTAGERLAVASEMTGGEFTEARGGTLRRVFLAVLGLFAVIGAVTVVEKIAGIVGWQLI